MTADLVPLLKCDADVSVGRPTKYVPEAIDTVLNAIRFGLPVYAAAAYAGITEPTLANWRRQHPDFDEQVKQARAECSLYYLQQIHRAAKRDVRAAIWLLEHTVPEFAQPAKASIDGKIEVRVTYVNRAIDGTYEAVGNED